MSKPWLFLKYLNLSLRLWVTRAFHALFGLTLVVLVATIAAAAAVTLAGQALLWHESGSWLHMPILYWFTDPWVSITEQLTLPKVQRHLSGPINPFITLGVWNLVLDANTFLPREGSYWPTYRWFGGFADWLAAPQRWHQLHAPLMYVMKTPIALFLSVLAALVYCGVRDYFDAMRRRLGWLQKNREVVREWLREPDRNVPTVTSKRGKSDD